MSEEVENFKYWLDTNTEKGVSHIPDYICNNVLNYIDKLQKELENLKEVDRQICCEELITKDKYQDILKENAELKELLG